MPEVTIVIPIYNRAGYLSRLFQLLDAVTYPHKHVILVDNGSQDSSFDLCQQFASKATYPVMAIQEKQKGAARARNAGLAACQTEWIYFFDSDDELSIDFLEHLTPLCTDRDAVFLTTHQVQGNRSMVRPYKDTGDVGYQILSSMLSTQSMLLRTDWLKSIGGWDDELTIWMDWELGIRVLLNRPRMAWFNGKAFHKVFVHDDSITGPSMSHNLEGKMACLQTVYGELQHFEQKKALYLRSKIFEGRLRREGTLKKISGFEEEMDAMTIRMGRFLSFYTRWGGRGAWRLGAWFCQKSRYC